MTTMDGALTPGGKLFKALFENTVVGISYLALPPGVRPTGEEKMVHCNRAMLDFFGYPLEEMLTKSIKDLAHPEDTSRDLAFLGELLAGARQSYHLEKRYIRKDGQMVWGYLSASLILPDGSGEPFRVIRTVEDIGELKKAQVMAQANEERYRLLYDDAPVCYHSLDKRGRVLDVNETWLKTLGYRRSEVLGRSLSDFLHPDWIERFQVSFPCFLDRGTTRDVEFDMRRKDGSTLTVSLSGKIGYNPDGSFRQTHCVFQDITERKRFHSAFVESEERFRSLASASFEGIFFHDQGTILDTNGVFAEMFGYEKKEIIGLQVTELITDSFSSERVAGGGPESEERQEVTGRRKDGSRFPLEIHRKEVPYKGRQVCVAAVRDMTAIKMAENSLRDINEELERRVEERTSVLSEINRQLEEEIRERERTEKNLTLRKSELKAKQQKLEEVNTALKVLLQESGVAKDEFEQKILGNIKRLVEPHLDDLEGLLTDREQKAVLDVIRRDILEISSSFSGKLAVENFGLTPREILIADYIKQGRTNKEIARLLQVSPSAIDFHRRNLRKKLNIKGKNVNLRSYLLTFVG